MYEKDTLSAIEALSAAQWLAFAPLAFQVTAVMRDRGVLAALAAAEPTRGCTIEEVVSATDLSVYAVRVLLEAGLGLHILWRSEGRYHLGKPCQFLLDDEMTRVNFDFTQNVCYQAAAHLGESLSQGRPAGLKELGPWATLYERLVPDVRAGTECWHAFDHFHSDQAFPAASARLALKLPQRLLDVSCNTGKWAQLCLDRFPAMEVGLVDLPPQLARARTRLDAAGFGDRVQCHPVNLLDPDAMLPTGYDLIWMSQFLDCFSEDQVIEILKKTRSALGPEGRLWILELFWDRQRFEAAAFSLQLTSLYFSCVANGNSQMYDSAVFLGLIERAGLVVYSLTDSLGGNHTLVECGIAA